MLAKLTFAKSGIHVSSKNRRMFSVAYDRGSSEQFEQDQIMYLAIKGELGKAVLEGEKAADGFSEAKKAFLADAVALRKAFEEEKDSIDIAHDQAIIELNANSIQELEKSRATLQTSLIDNAKLQAKVEGMLPTLETLKTKLASQELSMAKMGPQYGAQLNQGRVQGFPVQQRHMDNPYLPALVRDYGSYGRGIERAVANGRYSGNRVPVRTHETSNRRKVFDILEKDHPIPRGNPFG